MEKINVSVCYATKSEQFLRECQLSAHANVAMALRQSGVLDQFDELRIETLVVGIYGKKVALDSPLRSGDRVEIYRPLEIDPMTARRNRAKKKSKS